LLAARVAPIGVNSVESFAACSPDIFAIALVDKTKEMVNDNRVTLFMLFLMISALN
jgi:hypothetical protein